LHKRLTTKIIEQNNEQS